ncbi:RNA-directed DNA polymerase, eukaryota, reverse transcriptase zinc-binding domain protein [Tanacetum coccineum]|uniref:RNA-directed DNA polymerase, eukaryota, reverse transcriptase zinc-binding domain protein n=1 Tax=Tanacetum coccineum TaxID=301880 RepID=A0ABQ5DPM5_9ASTR
MVKWIMVCVTSTSFSIAVNGESCGYFKGGRGLRGDPISPYLFTLLMEILNLLMIRKIENNGLFQYHFGCKQLKIIHVCFADDLLMSCHGDTTSVRTIKEVIEEFGSVFGLLPNYNKSTIIFGSINEEDMQSILDICPFRVEKLPNPQLAKQSADICCLLKGFLWNQSDKANGKAKVAWKNLSDKDTLWVKWINTVKLKGRSIWEVNEDASDSWGWKNILKMRPDVRRHCFMKVWDGASTSVCFDCWSNLGVLNDIISYRDLYDARMDSSMTLKDFCRKHNGKWPDEWSNMTVYQDMQSGQENVNWKNLVWFSQNIPKHAFILCCDYSSQFWQLVKKKVEVVNNASIYLIWQERNARLFKEEKRNVDDLFRNLVEIVTLRLSSLKVKRSKEVHKIEDSWNVKTLFKTEYAVKKDKVWWIWLGYHVKGSPNVIRKVACLGGVPTSDALTAATPIQKWHPEMALLLLGLDLSVNRSFTLLLVMPPIRAPIFEGRLPLDLGWVFVGGNVARLGGFSMDA